MHTSKSGERKHFVILPVDFEGKSNCSVAKKTAVAFPPPSDATSAEVFLNVSTNIDAFRLNDYVIRQKQLCQVKTIDRKEDPFSLELLVLPDKYTSSSATSENVSSTAPSDPTSGVRHVNCELYHVAKIPHHVSSAKTSPPQSCHADLQWQEQNTCNAHLHERYFQLCNSNFGICNAVNRMRKWLSHAGALAGEHYTADGNLSCITSKTWGFVLQID